MLQSVQIKEKQTDQSQVSYPSHGCKLVETDLVTALCTCVVTVLKLKSI